MLDLFLKLESGQQLRLLPFSEELFYDTSIMYYCASLEKYFIFDDPNFINLIHREEVSRIIRYHMPVEFNGGIYFIKIGRKIKEFIDSICSANDFKPNDLLTNEVILDVTIGKHYVGGVAPRIFPKYDDCEIKVDHNFISRHFEPDLFDKAKEKFENHIYGLKLERKADIITYLKDNNMLQDKYNYLLRNIKINQFRQKKLDTTRMQLWNQVISVMAYADRDSESIEDIGYTKEDNIHQFMVDGYLFEIKLKDDV